MGLTWKPEPKCEGCDQRRKRGTTGKQVFWLTPRIREFPWRRKPARRKVPFYPSARHAESGVEQVLKAAKRWVRRKVKLRQRTSLLPD